jgi:hypothetical protein
MDSQGWSAAEPLVTDGHDDPRPGRGGRMLDAHGGEDRSSAPYGAGITSSRQPGAVCAWQWLR